MEINVLEDIMKYFYFNFISIYVIFGFMIIFAFISFKKQNYLKYSILFTICSCVALFFNQIFMGVLADNNTPNLEVWANQNLVFLIISIIFLLIQIILLIKNNFKSKK